MPDRKLKNVLFDLDGTLADTAPDLAFALNSLLLEQGRNALPLELIRPVVSRGGIAMIRLAFEMDETHPGFETLKQRFLNLYRANIASHTVLFDGIEQVLAELDSKQVPWGVVTNKATWLTQPLLQSLNLSERTDCVVCGDTLEYSKPHPAPLLHACELLHCMPEETVYVGDAIRDIEAGNNASMTTLIASYGYLDAEDKPETWGAHGIVTTPLEILDWVA